MKESLKTVFEMQTTINGIELNRINDLISLFAHMFIKRVAKLQKTAK